MLATVFVTVLKEFSFLLSGHRLDSLIRTYLRPDSVTSGSQHYAIVYQPPTPLRLTGLGRYRLNVCFALSNHLSY